MAILQQICPSVLDRTLKIPGGFLDLWEMLKDRGRMGITDVRHVSGTELALVRNVRRQAHAKKERPPTGSPFCMLYKNQLLKLQRVDLDTRSHSRSQCDGLQILTLDS